MIIGASAGSLTASLLLRNSDLDAVTDVTDVAFDIYILEKLDGQGFGQDWSGYGWKE
jgi:hypothetical protein